MAFNSADGTEDVSNNGPGLFISFEGGDGAGKTTQIDLLKKWLIGQGATHVVVTREPGGTEMGQEIRTMVLHSGDVSARAEALLYAADRAHHVETLIRPVLEQNAVVITDRYLDSSAAYQGSGRDIGVQEVRDISLWATHGLLPRLTVLIDIDPAEALVRRGDAPPDRLERESLEFHSSVREAFLSMAANEPERYLIVDGAAPPADVHARITRVVEPLVAEVLGRG